MERDLSWIDPAALRRAFADAGADIDPASRASEPFVIVEDVDDGAPGDGLPPFFVAPSVSLDRRLKMFVRELAEVSGSECVFVADDQGLLLAGSSAHERYVAGTALLDVTLRRARVAMGLSPLSSLAVELADSDYLHITWVDGPDVRVAVGLVLPMALSPGFVATIRKTLITLLQEPFREQRGDV
jgi:hypothetical protein